MKRILKRYFAVIMAVILTPVFIHGADHAVIIQYHNFGSGLAPETSVTLERFKAHLEELKKNDSAVWPLSKIISNLREGESLPDMCVAITIDDAYRSIYEKAYPLLLKYRFPATVFVATESVDMNLETYLNWEQMREMSKNGITFESHSSSHAYLIRRKKDESPADWEKRVREDITSSIERLESMLGKEVDLFAYPYGEYNPRLREIIKELDLVAFGQHSGAVWRGSDFAALPRFPVSGKYSEIESFRVKIRSFPLPVISEQPESPIIKAGSKPPALRLKLKAGDYISGSIACYVSGQGKADINWIDRENNIIEVSAEDNLPEGRSRYNITALHKDGSRYYWYSHLWITVPAEKDKEEE